MSDCDEISDKTSAELDAISKKLFDGDASYVTQGDKTYKLRHFPAIYPGYSVYSQDSKGYRIVYKKYGCLTRPY
jgi:hypothetical protein